MRRTMMTAGAALTALFLSAAPALAHECYNTQRSDQGDTHAEAGQGLSSFDELLDELCPEGDAIVLAARDSSGFDTDGVLVNVNAVMGGGALQNGHKTTDGHDIDYLPPELTAAIGQSFGTCFGG